MGWLKPCVALLDVSTIAQGLGLKPKRPARNVSQAQPWRETVASWMASGMEGKAMHTVLVHEHQLHHCYSSVYRLMRDIAKNLPLTDLTVRPSSNACEATQVDFGAVQCFMRPMAR